MTEEVEDPTIEFTPIPCWDIGEENVVEYTLPDNFEELGSDWIGIYEVYIL